MKHGLLMLLCCLIPIALVAAIGAFGLSLSGLGSTVIALMCPLMMIVMMFAMARGGHDQSGSQQPSCHSEIPEGQAKRS